MGKIFTFLTIINRADRILAEAGLIFADKINLIMLTQKYLSRYMKHDLMFTAKNH